MGKNGMGRGIDQTGKRNKMGQGTGEKREIMRY